MSSNWLRIKYFRFSWEKMYFGKFSTNGIFCWKIIPMENFQSALHRTDPKSTEVNSHFKLTTHLYILIQNCWYSLMMSKYLPLLFVKLRSKINTLMPFANLSDHTIDMQPVRVPVAIPCDLCDHTTTWPAWNSANNITIWHTAFEVIVVANHFCSNF